MSDPFDALRLPPEPVTPDPVFAARLRTRLAAALGIDPLELPVVDLPQRRSTPMTTTTTTTNSQDVTPAVSERDTAPTSTIVPYICVHDARRALAWYTDVFGATETVRYEGDDGRIGHAEVSIAGAELMLSDEYPEYGVSSPRTLGGTPMSLHLGVADVDDVHGRAVAAGATSLGAPEDKPYGERSCTLIDPFGHRWMVHTRIAEPTLDEINAAMEGFSATAPPPAADES